MPPVAPRLIPALADPRVELATGASLSVRPRQNVRLYAIYDARLRSNYESHSGTLGAEVRW